MDVVNYLFCDIRDRESFEGWPFTRDLRQGVVPGLKYYPQYRSITDEGYARLTAFPTSGLAAPEGLLPQHRDVGWASRHPAHHDGHGACLARR